MEYLLLFTFIIALVALYIGVKIGVNSEFDKVVVFFLAFVSCHVLYTFIYEIFDLPNFVDKGFPFGVAYGPIFYFALKAASGFTVVNRNALLHFIPFFLQLIVFLILLLSSDLDTTSYSTYYRILYRLIALSMIGYLVMGFVSNRKRNQLLGKTVRLIAVGVAILATIGFMILIMSLLPMAPSGTSIRQFPRYLIYTSILIQVCAVFRYQLERITKGKGVPAVNNLHEIASHGNVPLYEKSLISDSSMDLYEEKLVKLVKNKIFQDVELSLEALAKQVGAPKHHLTQLLNLRFKKSFNQYINGLRIEYACRLLQEDSNEYSIEELAYECGFNSKVSFNRNFKNITSFTPSEYRTSLNQKISV